MSINNLNQNDDLDEEAAGDSATRTGVRIDKFVYIILTLATIASAALLVVIVAFLFKEAGPVLTDGGWLQFISNEGWYPLEGMFGLLPMLVASLLLAMGALVLALPIGVIAAVFIEFYAHKKISTTFQWVINVLAGIPSVVFGLWGLTQLVPLILKISPPGASLLAGIIVLSLMIVPTVIITSLSTIRAVSSDIIKGALALGIGKTTRVFQIVIPAAWKGIVAGGLLALARALGETMAIIMVAGNVVQIPSSLFDPVRALTANIALEMAYATDVHRAGLFASGFILTLFVLLVAWVSSMLARQRAI